MEDQTQQQKLETATNQAKTYLEYRRWIRNRTGLSEISDSQLEVLLLCEAYRDSKDFSSSRKGRDNFEKNYEKGSYEKSDRDNKLGKTETVRLFIAKGKENNFDKRELFNYLEKEAGIRIDGESVKINGKFSFITVPKRQADTILGHFKNKGGSRSLVEIASEKPEFKEN